MATGQPDLENSSLRLPSKVTLDCVLLTIKANHHTMIVMPVKISQR